VASKTAIASDLHRLNFDPVGELVAVAEEAKQSDADPALLTVRIRVAGVLLQYLYPKLRSIEVREPKAPPSAGAVSRAKQEVFGYCDE
jgi:hypothetical protein